MKGIGMEIGQEIEVAGAKASVLAVHTGENAAPVVLAYNTHRREYVVADAVRIDGWTEYTNTRHTNDEHNAMALYARRVIRRLFVSRNAKAPDLTWLTVNTEN